MDLSMNHSLRTQSLVALAMALATPHPAAAALARALIIMVAREISNLAMSQLPWHTFLNVLSICC